MLSPQNEPNWDDHYSPPKAEIGPTRSNTDRTVRRWVLVIGGVLGSWTLLGVIISVVIFRIYVGWRYPGGNVPDLPNDADLVGLMGWFAGGLIGTVSTLVWAFGQGAKTRSAINRGNARAEVFHKDDDLAAVSVHAQGRNPSLGGS
jgi:hypothetical protein